MNITIKENNSYNITMMGKPSRFSLKNFKQKILDKIPAKDIKDVDKYDKWEKSKNRMSNPATNRAIMGCTALVTQPVIDYYNHRVDKETRKVSKNRTIAKIIAGSVVGICVRGLCFNLTHKMTNPNANSKFAKFLLPNNVPIKEMKSKIENYRSALSTIIALIVMTVFTNGFLDAPLTMFLTNKFNAKSKNISKTNEVIADG